MSHTEQTSIVQMNMEECCEKEKRRQQRQCRHHFLFSHLFDFDADRIIDLSECERCGLQK